MNPIKRIWKTAIAAWHNRLSSDERPHYETAPEDRISFGHKVIYGLGAEFDGNLRRRHLRDESNLYNTYRHHGLPPPPIALPRRAAIHAALNPAAGKSLFFVARGDGGHVFSETLAEHERAVRKYQLQRRSDYRSSPPRN